MKRYFIEKVDCGEVEGGMACGPISGAVVAEAKVKSDDGETFFLSLAEVTGIPNFFKTEVSTFAGQMKMDDDVIDILNSGSIECDEYESILEEPEHPEWIQLYRLLIFLVREANCKDFAETVEGKYIDEIDIPLSDIEM